MHATELQINLLASNLFNTFRGFENGNMDIVRLGLKFMGHTIDNIKKQPKPPSKIEQFSNRELINELTRRLAK